MPFDPDKHHRHSLRLNDYDYSREGMYFVTLCTFDRGCYFEEFPELKEIVDKFWIQIPLRHGNVILDEYVIMPNHLHGIIINTGHPQGMPLRDKPNDIKTIGEIIGAFKSLCVTAWLDKIRRGKINVRGKFWQRNFYEQIIRNEDELSRSRQYISENPLKWESDDENPL